MGSCDRLCPMPKKKYVDFQQCARDTLSPFFFFVVPEGFRSGNSRSSGSYWAPRRRFGFDAITASRFSPI